MQQVSLYVHIPWCLKKCPYCDFNSHSIKAVTPEIEYINALLHDLSEDVRAYKLTKPLGSIFIGGGTPSLFSPDSINRLLTGIKKQIPFSKDIEITLEANPGTFESNKFKEFRSLGINRLSIGVQSFDDRLLKKIGRVHSGRQAIIAAEIAKNAGFQNFNLDLMFGLPSSNTTDSVQDIKTAISLQPSHISFYQLTLEPNTYFYKFPPQLPSDEAIFSTQTISQAILEENGYSQYEISAYSRSGYQCRHNVNYWRFGDYLGIGAGAHGKISEQKPNRIVRTEKYKNPDFYLQSRKTFGNVSTIAETDLPLEFVMNHLRLKEGFCLQDFTSRTGLDISSLEPGLSISLQQGLLSQNHHQIFCTEKGWLFLDTVLQNFIN